MALLIAELVFRNLESRVQTTLRIPTPAAGDVPSSVRLELKVGELWLSGSTTVDIMAGLTNIDTVKLSGSIGPSWSGSAGVG